MGLPSLAMGLPSLATEPPFLATHTHNIVFIIKTNWWAVLPNSLPQASSNASVLFCPSHSKLPLHNTQGLFL